MIYFCNQFDIGSRSYVYYLTCWTTRKYQIKNMYRVVDFLWPFTPKTMNQYVPR